MEIFAPHNLPGVGMGDLASVTGLCGLLGLSVTSGMLVAEGIVGTAIFAASALAVLAAKPDLGGSVPFAVLPLVLLLVVAVMRHVLGARSRRLRALLVGAAADAPETRSARSAVSSRDALAQALAIASVLLAGALVGYAWAEWNEVPFQLGDTESIAGLAIGAIVAALGGDAAWRFLSGAVRAGGSSLVVGVVVALVADLANALSFYVPFVGGVVVLATGLLTVRLRRRTRQKYAGLRILS